MGVTPLPQTPRRPAVPAELADPRRTLDLPPLGMGASPVTGWITIGVIAACWLTVAVTIIRDRASGWAGHVPADDLADVMDAVYEPRHTAAGQSTCGCTWTYQSVARHGRAWQRQGEARRGEAG